IRYSRGFFSSRPNEETCGTFSGDPNRNAQPITDEVRADIGRWKAALAEGARSFEYIQIEKSDGSIGAGSWFAADGCTTYYYDPNWTSLPEANSKIWCLSGTPELPSVLGAVPAT